LVLALESWLTGSIQQNHTMDAERFDAWQWVMWLLLCLAGLMPGEVAVDQTAESSSVRASAVVVGVEQDVKVTAVGISKMVAEEEGMLLLADMAGRLSRPSKLDDNTSHLNLRSTLITPCLSNDRGMYPLLAQIREEHTLTHPRNNAF
jgi:hypothetical protein